MNVFYFMYDQGYAVLVLRIKTVYHIVADICLGFFVFFYCMKRNSKHRHHNKLLLTVYVISLVITFSSVSPRKSGSAASRTSYICVCSLRRSFCRRYCAVHISSRAEVSIRVLFKVNTHWKWPFVSFLVSFFRGPAAKTNMHSTILNNFQYNMLCCSHKNFYVLLS